MESRDQAPNSWWCTSSFFPPQRSLWGWHSVGLQTEAIAFSWCPPVRIPPCKLFIPPAPFCERGLQLRVGLFSHFQGSKIPLGAIDHGCTWERRDSHSESGASLIWRDEWQSPGEEVKRQLLWVVPGPSPALGPQGLRESVQPQHPGTCSTASAAFPSWGPEGLGHPGVQAGPGAAGICGKWKQNWVWGPWWVMKLRPGSLPCRLMTIEGRGCLVLWEVWESGATPGLLPIWACPGHLPPRVTASQQPSAKGTAGRPPAADLSRSC